jgi:hypothetical protein
LTRLFKVQNWYDSDLKIAIEPQGAAFSVPTRSYFEIVASKYDLGDDVILFPSSDGLMISIMGDEPDFLDQLSFRLDGIELDY